MGPVDVLSRARGARIVVVMLVGAGAVATYFFAKSSPPIDPMPPAERQIMEHVVDTLPQVNEFLARGQLPSAPSTPTIDPIHAARMAHVRSIAEMWSGPVARGEQRAGTTDVDDDGRLDCWRATYVGIGDLDWYVDAELGCAGARVRVSQLDVFAAQLAAL